METGGEVEALGYPGVGVELGAVDAELAAVVGVVARGLVVHDGAGAAGEAEDGVGFAAQGDAGGLVGGLEPGPVGRVYVFYGVSPIGGKGRGHPGRQAALPLQVVDYDLLGVAVNAAEDAGEALPGQGLDAHPYPGAAGAEAESGVAAQFGSRNGQAGHCGLTLTLS